MVVFVIIVLFSPWNAYLSYVSSANAMKKANVLCKSLATVESLGSVNVIASDKTGTLTQNRMSVSNMYTRGGRITEAEASREPAQVQHITAIAGLCNDAEFESTDGPVMERKVNGDATGEASDRHPHGIT
jgi:sodium/potassium-transporting ATPase subunit alpha